MPIRHLPRAVVTLAGIPFLTFLTSIMAILVVVVLRRPPEAAHRLAIWWARTIVRLAGVTVEVQGGEDLVPGQPYIFAANHRSQFDIFALQGFLGHSFRWLAKKELFAIPVFGRGMRAAGYIPVDRAHGRAALVSLAEAAGRIASGVSVIIFPEGTRSRDGRLQPFKAGVMVLALKAGVPVVPVAVAGTYQILPKGKLLVNPGSIAIRIGRPIPTRDRKPADKQLLADEVRQAVARLLGEETAPAASDQAGLQEA
ncbi:MAG: lysophospholipid acyltransferase family protein [Thermodesulfobacteriota bacterium]